MERPFYPFVESRGTEYATCPVCGTRLKRPTDGEREWERSHYLPRSSRPAAVRFAIGARPALSKGQADALARLLDVDRDITASRLAARIRWTVKLNSDRPPLPSTDIELDRDELSQIAAIFENTPELLKAPALARLNLEVNVELVRFEQ